MERVFLGLTSVPVQFYKLMLLFCVEILHTNVYNCIS